MAPKPEAPKTTAPNNAANVVAPPPDNELQKRMLAATRDPAPVPKVDNFTGKLICYHAITCAPVGTPDAIDPNKVNISFQPGSMKCVGKHCSRWNPDELECYDNTQARAAVDTAKILNLIDGHARMSAEK